MVAVQGTCCAFAQRSLVAARSSFESSAQEEVFFVNSTPAAAGVRARRLGTFATVLLLVAGLLVAATRPAAAQDAGACAVTLQSTVSAQGFVHRRRPDRADPGERPPADRCRSRALDLVVPGDAASSAAGGRSRRRPPEQCRSDQARLRSFDSQGFNCRFIADGLKSYTQAVLYVLTGEEVYPKNALDIIRIWEQWTRRSTSTSPTRISTPASH